MTDATHPVVYLDANPFIYMLEGEIEIARSVAKLMKLLRTKPELGATSELMIAEVLPKAPTTNHRRLSQPNPLERDIPFGACITRRPNRVRNLSPQSEAASG
jgi:hypothetical protein